MRWYLHPRHLTEFPYLELRRISAPHKQEKCEQSVKCPLLVLFSLLRLRHWMKMIFSKEEIFCNFSFPFLTPQSKNFLFFVFHHKTRAWTCGFTRVPRLLKRDSPVSNFWQDLRVKKHRIVRWQLFSLCWACWHVLPFHNVNQQRKFPFHLWKEVLVSKRRSYIHNTKPLSNGACSCHMPSAKRPCFLVIFIYIVAREKRTATE